MSESFPLLHDPPVSFQVRKADDQWQLKLEEALVRQAVDRGPVPESAWAPYTYSMTIRRKIEEIVIESAYPKGSTFHPLDPVELMFVLRYGDLNEVEILIAIEEELGFKISDSLCSQLVSERTTFIDFIKMVESGTST